MADELLNIRSKFVAKVSPAVLKQLTDDLLQEKVLNDGEVGEVIEGPSTTMDKARAFIDMVRKKGDEASSQLKRCLQTRDPALFKELGLKCPDDLR
uniref:CARD domain-containing protein n=1 Tax=Anguilla anguilla TaxID=7936 RepID=A0A0E9W4B6_ANGAN